jgi:hypothetical protein
MALCRADQPECLERSQRRPAVKEVFVSYGSAHSRSDEFSQIELPITAIFRAPTTELLR